MTTAENIQLLHDAGNTTQARRMAENEHISRVENADGSAHSFEFADGSVWQVPA